MGLLLLLGLGSRLVTAALFPVLPISDFRALLDFSLLMRDHSVVAGGFYWTLLSPGLPLVLSVILRIFSSSPETVARLATAVVTGLAPVLPFAIWRRMAPLWVRFLAAAALALWPGQILFSGVVAQDNWVLAPAIGLGALAARSLILTDRPSPIAAGLLYALGVAMRQEMLVVLLPLLLAAAGLASRQTRRWQLAARCALAAGVPLLLLATQRQIATGRFALTSEHSGQAILGSYIPGATANAWADPIPYVASVEPALLRDIPRLRREAGRLALREAWRRPLFHAARILASTGHFLIASETANFYWCLSAPEAQPPARRASAAALAARAVAWVRAELVVVQALFFAALFLALRRNPAVLVLSVAIGLKVVLHAVTVAQGRYFLAVTALEILVIALGFWEVQRLRSPHRAVAAFGAGTAVALALLLFTPRAMASVQAHDRDVQRTYRFVLTPSGGGTFDCAIGQGRLLALMPGREATLATLHPEPAPGETATAVCTSTGAAASTPLAIQLFDPYAPGGQPGRILQSVRIDGVEVFRHDPAAAPGTGWFSVPLGPLSAGKVKTVAVQLQAVQPDPGLSWGSLAETRFRLAPSGDRP